MPQSGGPSGVVLVVQLPRTGYCDLRDLVTYFFSDYCFFFFLFSFFLFLSGLFLGGEVTYSLPLSLNSKWTGLDEGGIMKRVETSYMP